MLDICILRLKGLIFLNWMPTNIKLYSNIELKKLSLIETLCSDSESVGLAFIF